MPSSYRYQPIPPSPFSPSLQSSTPRSARSRNLAFTCSRFRPKFLIMLGASTILLLLGLGVPYTIGHFAERQDLSNSTNLISLASASTSNDHANIPSTTTHSDSAITSSIALNTSTFSGANSTSTSVAPIASSTSSAPSKGPSGNATTYYPPLNLTYISNPVSAPINRSYYNPSSKWNEAHKKASRYLSNWTIEEKVLLTTGMGWEQGRCLGNIAPIPSRNFSGLCLMDSPLGIRLTDYNSAFPAGVNVASTFDKDLMYARGFAMGQEFKGKGAHIALGPMTNMYRVPAGGRNWEGFGGDPYLSGWATQMTVWGIQDAGVQATVKHYIGNEQERNRTTSDSQFTDRTMREIYSHPFLKAVQADVASVMCSYNLVNGSWACQNSEMLNGILKEDFGFRGYVMSDWNAQHSGVLSANSGLDMTMPGDIEQKSLTSYWGLNLTESINNGSVPIDRLDDMAQRIMAAYFLLGQDQGYSEVNFDSARPLAEANNSHVDVRDEHWKVIQHIGAASTVLLKNINNTLPLKSPRKMTLIGSDLGPSYKGPNGYSDRGGDEGTLAMGWGSGTCNFPYLVDPLQAIAHQARKDGTTLDWWFNDFDVDSAKYWATGYDVALVGINSDSGEGYITVDGNEGDRNNISAWHNGSELVQAVASVNNNTVVIVHSVGPIDMEDWIDHPNVTAVLWAGLPGQESGNSLVDVLYGWYNPSGRLPYTIAKKLEDYPAELVYVDTNIPEHPVVEYKEELNIDYRHFLSKNVTPRYEFGYGLSYTTFEYNGLDMWDNEAWNERDLQGEDDDILEEKLHKTRWTISVDVTNTGDVFGCDIPQLYLAYPPEAGEPPKVLRDFNRVQLAPAETKNVQFELSKYDISIWDVVKQKWVIPNGNFGIEVGRSSMDQKSVMLDWCFEGCN
uniref:beta-glucosidase n=1 Tax=Kwoniella pini CBS 10737 TaxID=1296096 RepID=A0A1B9IDZ7_9TREE|nr:beta-glucosidase [Kwoniella pini CBS 10737]OCF53805.1 beta-glucosidase [Kwoniella pini CBS 10737]